jgi:glucosamine-6-phosphate deaminase
LDGGVEFHGPAAAEENAVKKVTYDLLEVDVHPDREALGLAAASRVAESIRAACAAGGEARVIFACAPSQNEFLAALVRESIPWENVVVFQMDEFAGLPPEHPQSFGYYLRSHLLDHIPTPGATHLILAESDPASECARYSNLVAEKPIDLACLGVGENGHIALNDPPVANFKDPHLVKMVKLDECCRRQQVNDGCFPHLEAVPTHAFTLTVPALLAAREISCVTPGERKANAVHDALAGALTKECPASILRRHPRAVLHLDPNAAAHLEP